MGEPAIQPAQPLYQLTITATGEVRDSDGNLVSSDPIEATTTVTAEQAARILEGQDTP